MADDLSTATALYEEGLSAFRAGDNERCRQLTSESLRIGRALEDDDTIGSALMGLCRVALRDHDADRLATLTHELDELAGTSGDTWWRIVSVHMRAEFARILGEIETAIRLYRTSLALSEEIGSENMVAAECFNLSLAFIAIRQLTEAEEALTRHFAVRRRLDGADVDPTGLIAVAALLASRGDLPEAVGVALACRAAFAERGLVPDPADAAPLEAVERMATTTRPHPQPPTVEGIALRHGLLRAP